MIIRTRRQNSSSTKIQMSFNNSKIPPFMDWFNYGVDNQREESDDKLSYVLFTTTTILLLHTI